MNNKKFPELGPGDIHLYFPAPGYYTSGCGQQMSSAPNTTYDPNTTSKYPQLHHHNNSLTLTSPICLPNESATTKHRHIKGQPSSKFYQNNSPLGPEGGSKMQNYHPDFPRISSELGQSETTGLHHHLRGGTS